MTDAPAPPAPAATPPLSSPPVSPAASRNMWIAFLLVCFLLTGLVGLFASYGPSIPLERGLRRVELLDRALAAVPPDAAGLGVALGKANAAAVLSGPGDLQARAARARAAIVAEALDDEAGVGARTRLMIYTVTILSAVLGTGILLVVSRRER